MPDGSSTESGNGQPITQASKEMERPEPIILRIESAIRDAQKILGSNPPLQEIKIQGNGKKIFEQNKPQFAKLMNLLETIGWVEHQPDTAFFGASQEGSRLQTADFVFDQSGNGWEAIIDEQVSDQLLMQTVIRFNGREMDIEQRLSTGVDFEEKPPSLYKFTPPTPS